MHRIYLSAVAYVLTYPGWDEVKFTSRTLARPSCVCVAWSTYLFPSKTRVQAGEDAW